jgi:hypothetical protein
MGKIPSSTVTFLFTDIEGSTKLAQGALEAMTVTVNGDSYLTCNHPSLCDWSITCNLIWMLALQECSCYYFVNDAIPNAHTIRRISLL